MKIKKNNIKVRLLIAGNDKTCPDRSYRERGIERKEGRFRISLSESNELLWFFSEIPLSPPFKKGGKMN